MPLLLYHFDEDATLTAAHSDGVVTNRSASGPITLSLPDNPPAGTPLEVHVVEPYPVTVAGQSAGDNVLGQGQSVELAQGAAVRLVYTSAHFWSGFRTSA